MMVKKRQVRSVRVERIKEQLAPGRAGSRTWRTMSERAAIYGHPARGASCADVLIEALELAAALRRASASGA
ncbi:MAG TPA: hypothetical protein VGC50_01985 [Gammaproteobacteria bacterium]|jgi:hypothetical protein